MKALQYLAIVFITLGVVIAAVPQNTTHPYKLSPEQLLEQVNSGIQYFSPDQIADMIITEDPSFLLIEYNFRKGAGMKLGGAESVSDQSPAQPLPSLPKIAPQTNRKRVQGGC
jgi:hypothetical protein